MVYQFLLSSIFNFKILLIILAISLIFILIKFRKQRNIAPGPRSLAGIIKLFKPFVFKYLYELTKQYGPVVEISIFGQPLIIFGSYDVLKEAFVTNGDNFVDRPTSCAFEEYCHDKGLAYSNGELWKEQKKFAMSHLLRSGFLESYDKIISDEIELAFNEIQRKNGKSFDPKQLFVQMTTNIVMRMAASERLEYNTTDDFIQKNMHGIVSNFQMSNPVNFFPPLKYILKSHKRLKKYIQNINDYLLNIVKEHENSFDENNIRDYVDAFLFKMYEEEEKGNTNTTFTREQLIASLKDFLLAGSETSSFALLYSIIFLLHHPHIQTKVQKEINDVIGTSRNPQMADCSKLPFTHATILETQRLSNVVPLGGPRVVKENIKIQGYDIPKGAYVMPNLYFMHLDPKNWNNPTKFDPNRFLDTNGEIIKNMKNFWPFSTGHRECMGEVLAKSELFLIFTSVFQRYTVKSLSPELPSMTGCIEGAAMSPLPFEVSFILK